MIRRDGDERRPGGRTVVRLAAAALLLAATAGCADGAAGENPRAVESAIDPVGESESIRQRGAPAVDGTTPVATPSGASVPAGAPAVTAAATPSTSTTVPASTTTTTDPRPVPGASGPAVEALQRRLAELGYHIGAVDGSYGGATSSAVMAFQKVEGLTADGVSGPATLARLDDPRGAVPTGGGLRIEIDLGRQVLFVVGAGPTRIFNTSTGNNEPFTWPDGTPGLAYTPTGTFAVYHRVDGVDDGALGAMYRPMYFHGDWAVHGSGYVPAYPASHGCARVSNSAQDWIWANIPTGTAVVIA